MMRIVVAATENCEVGHLKSVGGTTAALQSSSHRVPHVEVGLRNICRQV